MRTPTSFVAALLPLAVLAAAACGGESVNVNVNPVGGSGHVKTEARNVSGFDSVDLSGLGTLTIRQSGTDSLQVQADDNLLPLITSEVVGTTLKLGTKPGVVLSPTTLNYTVTLQRLRSVAISGVGSATATDVDSPQLAVELTGAGHLSVSGRANSERVQLSGTGHYDGSNLTCQDADVAVSGAGLAVVNASNALEAQITGVGTVEYLGEPAVTQHVTGAGMVRRVP